MEDETRFVSLFKKMNKQSGTTPYYVNEIPHFLFHVVTTKRGCIQKKTVVIAG